VRCVAAIHSTVRPGVLYRANVPASDGPPRLPLLALLHADLTAMAEGAPVSGLRLLLRLLVHARWRAVVTFRLAQSCLRSRATRPLALWLADRVLAVSGAELKPASTIGPGLVLKHTTGLVVGAEVVAGAHLTLHQNVTLGDRHPFGGQPTLGDDVTVGAGACVLGPITVGAGAVVAANAVVLADVPPGAVVAGAPAQIVAGRHSPRGADHTLRYFELGS
jgi:serine O-acetyltransferase